MYSLKERVYSVLLFTVTMGFSLFSFADDFHSMIQKEMKIMDGVPTEWIELKEAEGLPPLDLLVSSMKSNLGAIETFKASYSAEMRVSIDKNLVTSMLQEYRSFDTDPQRVLRIKADVVSDTRSNKISRTINYLEDYFEYEGERLKTDIAESTYSVTVDTPVESIRVEDAGDVFYGVKELQNYPDVKLGHVVRIEPPEHYKEVSFPEGLDPYEYYRFRFWAAIDAMYNILAGKNGEQKQTSLREKVHIYESHSENEKKWYRYQQFMNNNDEINILWNETAGFMPVFCIWTTPHGTVKSVQEVSWKCINNIYTPDQTSYTLYKGSKIANHREMKIDEIEMNKTINPDNFTLDYVDTHNKELVINDIEKKVYRLENGQPELIGKFNSKYKNKPRLTVDKTKVSIAVFGLILIGIGLILRIRSRK